MVDMIVKCILGCDWILENVLVILQEYGNMLFFFVVINFEQYFEDMVVGENGVMCVFGVGYGVGVVVVRKC